MDWQSLKVAEWLPDQAPFENPGATTAHNCIAGASSYLPFAAPVDYSQATSANNYVRGATAIRNNANVTYVYAGDAGKLYQLSATGWDDISVAGAYSGTATEEVWKFAQYGTQQVIATNYSNVPQKIVPGSAAVALGGSPPRARYVATIRDWLVFANLHDGTARPNRVQWSGYNNSEYWTRDVALQSDYQDIYEGGWITGLAEAGGLGVVLSDTTVHLMQYQGPPVTWSFQRIANALGTKIPGSVVSHRDRVWWIGESDIWEYSGGQIQAIATEKVARTFFADLDGTSSHRVVSAVDPVRGVVVWAYPGLQNIGGLPNKALIYAYNVGRWTLASLEAVALFNFLSPGYTLDGLDAISSSLDALGASLDADAWKGGALSFAAFSSTNKLQTFTGTPLSATLETAELRAAIGRFTEITNSRPIHEGGSAMVRIGTRNLQDAAINWTGPAECNNSGECNVRTNARFSRARLELSGNWTHAIGVDVYARSSGKR